VQPVYLDSPMAIEALKFYARRGDELDQSFQGRRNTLTAFQTQNFRTVPSPRDSADLVNSTKPAIVVASSGMATGGRVLHHLDRVLPDPRHTVLFVGYQAAGTRGRSLVDGARQVKMLGHLVDVAARIEKIDSMSAHADQGEILRWLGGFSRPPGRMLIVHGEPVAQDALKAKIKDTLGWDASCPDYRESVEL
jgi:metallo-beta-lactamase family protein